MFSVEITVDPNGVKAVRIVGKSWQQHEAYALLDRISAVIEQLDAAAKGTTVSSEDHSDKILQ